MSKNLIIYYSRSGQNYVDGSVVNLTKGNTEKAVEILQKCCECDVFKIETVKEYPEDYYECTEAAKKELESGARPELKKYLENLDGYEYIFVCGPCWWGTFPCAVFSQLEKLNWEGKKVLALMTHEGSGLGYCEDDLRNICKGAKIGQGLALKGNEAALRGKVMLAWSASQLNYKWTE